MPFLRLAAAASAARSAGGEQDSLASRRPLRHRSKLTNAAAVVRVPNLLRLSQVSCSGVSIER